MTKLESCSELCLFVGYPKETRGFYFDSTEEQKVFVSTNATFLEENYMKNFKPKIKLFLEELIENVINQIVADRVQESLHKEKS